MYVRTSCRPSFNFHEFPISTGTWCNCKSFAGHFRFPKPIINNLVLFRRLAQIQLPDVATPKRVAERASMTASYIYLYTNMYVSMYACNKNPRQQPQMNKLRPNLKNFALRCEFDAIQFKTTRHTIAHTIKLNFKKYFYYIHRQKASYSPTYCLE